MQLAAVDGRRGGEEGVERQTRYKYYGVELGIQTGGRAGRAGRAHQVARAYHTHAVTVAAHETAGAQGYGGGLEIVYMHHRGAVERVEMLGEHHGRHHVEHSAERQCTGKQPLAGKRL